MKNQLDGRYIKSPCRDVGRYQNRAGGRRSGKAFDCAKTRFLWHLRVQGMGWDVEGLKEGCQAADGGD